MGRDPRSTLFPYTTLFRSRARSRKPGNRGPTCVARDLHPCRAGERWRHRSEEHTSELQSLRHLVCRLLLEKKNTAATMGKASPFFPSPTAARTTVFS